MTRVDDRQASGVVSIAIAVITFAFLALHVLDCGNVDDYRRHPPTTWRAS